MLEDSTRTAVMAVTSTLPEFNVGEHCSEPLFGQRLGLSNPIRALPASIYPGRNGPFDFFCCTKSCRGTCYQDRQRPESCLFRPWSTVLNGYCRGVLGGNAPEYHGSGLLDGFQALAQEIGVSVPKLDVVLG